eukprot:NODE_5034_length_1817_cov_4.094675.p1 GENE.NODE_5034_length_1817_cov_4.094675~~NODE_5034_length_1817_cov_4.094675.p1  ORF type:complete len:340 (-),score=110.15 NODE_5034_length_1817_cov_4.094675:797-1699(-)
MEITSSEVDKLRATVTGMEITSSETADSLKAEMAHGFAEHHAKFAAMEDQLYNEINVRQLQLDEAAIHQTATDDRIKRLCEVVSALDGKVAGTATAVLDNFKKIRQMEQEARARAKEYATFTAGITSSVAESAARERPTAALAEQVREIAKALELERKHNMEAIHDQLTEVCGDIQDMRSALAREVIARTTASESLATESSLWRREVLKLTEQLAAEMGDRMLSDGTLEKLLAGAKQCFEKECSTRKANESLVFWRCEEMHERLKNDAAELTEDFKRFAELNQAILIPMRGHCLSSEALT